MAIGCALERLLKDLSAAGRVLSAPAADPEQPYAPPKSMTSADFRHLQEISKKTPAGVKRSFKQANPLAGRHQPSAARRDDSLVAKQRPPILRRGPSMFEKDNSIPQLSFFELERQARIERNRMIQAGALMAVEATAKWLRMLVLRGKRQAQAFAAERRRRRAIRELQQLDDRTLQDIGVRRNEIESAVRHGLPARASWKQRQRHWNNAPRQRAA